jgi:hypothetical protein
MSSSSGCSRLILLFKAAGLGALLFVRSSNTRSHCRLSGRSALRVRRLWNGHMSLYESLGFQRVPDRDWYVPGEDVLLWVFRLELRGHRGGLPGGRLRSLSQSFVGPLAEAALERMSFDWCSGAPTPSPPRTASARPTTPRPGSRSGWPAADGRCTCWRTRPSSGCDHFHAVGPARAALDFGDGRRHGSWSGAECLRLGSARLGSARLGSARLGTMKVTKTSC